MEDRDPKWVCAWWTKLQGKNPQNEQQFDEWGCALTWMPILQVETSQRVRQLGAAIESFRNETVNMSRYAIKERNRLLAQDRVGIAIGETLSTEEENPDAL